jgi:hypothetical protein
MMVCDLFVIFDTVQFTPRHEENRAKLKGPQGTQWLTVPMRQSSRDQRIYDTKVDDEQPWRQRAAGILHHFYGKTPYYSAYSAEILGIIDRPYATLTHIDRASWEPALRRLGINCQFVYASELPVVGKGPKQLLDICKYLDADVYLSGGFGRQYLNTDEFATEGVEVQYHEYHYPVYTQRHGDFVPFLSYLDMLFNIGLDRDIVLSGGEVLIT